MDLLAVPNIWANTVRPDKQLKAWKAQFNVPCKPTLTSAGRCRLATTLNLFVWLSGSLWSSKAKIRRKKIGGIGNGEQEREDENVTYNRFCCSNLNLLHRSTIQATSETEKISKLLFTLRTEAAAEIQACLSR